MADEGGRGAAVGTRGHGARRCFAPSCALPRLPAHFVRRPQLFELLDALVAVPITVVVAPAGSGKTSLLAGWIEESSVAHVWLSLDEADRDPAQLWSGIIAALETLAPGSGANALDRLWRSDAITEVAGQLLNDLEEDDGAESVLVIDDLHLVEDEDIAPLLEVFLLHLPAWLHVVLRVPARAGPSGRSAASEGPAR